MCWNPSSTAGIKVWGNSATRYYAECPNHKAMTLRKKKRTSTSRIVSHTRYNNEPILEQERFSTRLLAPGTCG